MDLSCEMQRICDTNALMASIGHAPVREADDLCTVLRLSVDRADQAAMRLPSESLESQVDTHQSAA